MGIKRHKPEEIITNLRQVEMLCGQGMPRIDASRQVQITEQMFFHRRKLYGGMGTDQLKEQKRLRIENERLRRAVSDLTLDKLVLSEAARGNYRAFSRRRACIDHVRSRFHISERRACRVLGQHRSTQRRLPAPVTTVTLEHRPIMHLHSNWTT